MYLSQEPEILPGDDKKNERLPCTWILDTETPSPNCTRKTEWKMECVHSLWPEIAEVGADQLSVVRTTPSWSARGQ